MLEKLKHLWHRSFQTKRQLSQRTLDKRRLEALLRQVGQSKSEAKRLAFEFFSHS